MVDYSIDKKIPVPATPRSLPIEDLKVGESILFPNEDRSKVQIKASRLKKDRGLEFTVRKVDEVNARVWRTA